MGKSSPDTSKVGRLPGDGSKRKNGGIAVPPLYTREIGCKPNFWRKVEVSYIIYTLISDGFISYCTYLSKYKGLGEGLINKLGSSSMRDP